MKKGISRRALYKLYQNAAYGNWKPARAADKWVKQTSAGTMVLVRGNSDEFAAACAGAGEAPDAVVDSMIKDYVTQKNRGRAIAELRAVTLESIRNYPVSEILDLAERYSRLGHGSADLLRHLAQRGLEYAEKEKSGKDEIPVTLTASDLDRIIYTFSDTVSGAMLGAQDLKPARLIKRWKKERGSYVKDGLSKTPEHNRAYYEELLVAIDSDAALVEKLLPQAKGVVLS